MPLQVFSSATEWCEGLGPSRKATVVTVGNFDGLHLGHQQLLRGVVERARELGRMAAAVTFDPHPVRILRPAEAPPLITTLAQRLKGFERFGLDAALVLKFDAALSQVSPKEFVREIVVGQLRVQRLCVGENFRFGQGHTGDVALLRQMARELGFEVEIVPPVRVRGVAVSSTAIRAAIGEGRVSCAARLLGRPFALTGQIRPGTGRGGRLVFPTLNVAAEQELIPRIGVYATETIVAARAYRSATNVGVRPTFDGKHLAIESHLFNFSEALTSGPIEVHFWRRLRDEQKFAGPDALRAQVQRDLARARSFFRRLDRAAVKVHGPAPG